jgi:hypothetical protein
LIVGWNSFEREESNTTQLCDCCCSSKSGAAAAAAAAAGGSCSGASQPRQTVQEVSIEDFGHTKRISQLDDLIDFLLPASTAAN